MLAWLVAPAIPLALLLGLMSFHGAFNALLGVLSLLFGALLAAFLLTGGLQFLIDFAFVGLGFDHWRVAVTDQRVLL